jgi:hypothetical protein
MTSCNAENILISFVCCYFEIACIEPDIGFSKRQKERNEGRKEEKKGGTSRRGGRSKQLMDDLKKKKWNSKLKEEALDRTFWRTLSQNRLRVDDDILYIHDNRRFSVSCSFL